MSESKAIAKVLRFLLILMISVAGISLSYGFLSSQSPADCKKSTEEFEAWYQFNSTAPNHKSLAKKLTQANIACGRNPYDTEKFSFKIDSSIVEAAKSTE